MIQIFWCLCNLAWFTSKLYILLLQISFYLSPNRAKQISLLFWSTPSWISYSPSIQSKNPRFVDNSSCEDSNESDQSISRFTQARRSKVPDKRIAIPVMRFAFSRRRSLRLLIAIPQQAEVRNFSENVLPLLPAHTAIGPFPNRLRLIPSDSQTVHIAGFAEFRKATDRHVGQLRSDSVRKV